MTGVTLRGRSNAAFTLIELLVVVAIIAILAAIAIPNFLEAQTRSKISRAHAEMRSLSTGLNAYFVDFNKMPGEVGMASALLDPVARRINLTPITTPVAYVTTIAEDPFYPGRTGVPTLTRYYYVNLEFVTNLPPNAFAVNKYLLGSRGPDLEDDPVDVLRDLVTRNVSMIEASGIYDPTNGTVSRGDLIRTNCSVLGGL